MSHVLSIRQKLARFPGGAWLFSSLVCWKAPYFSSILPRVLALEPGRCVVRFAERRSVRNHIGTVHAIAMCNAAELAGGLATDATIPSSMRWIPKGMTVRYLNKARGTLTATATVPAIEVTDDGRELEAYVVVTDSKGEAVFDARITMWVSPRPNSERRRSEKKRAA